MAFVLAVIGILALHVATLAWLAAHRPWTQDELSYLKAGALLRRELAWDVPHTTFHGPLPFFANQLLAGLAPTADADAEFTHGRFGMLVFAVLAGIGVAWLCCQLFDRRHALVALAVHAANPVVLANAPLMTADMAMAALATLAFAGALAWLRRPSPLRFLLAAALVGAALATKYLNLFLLPVFGVCLLRHLWVRRQNPHALGRAVVLVGGGAAVVLTTLHACYLFAAPRWLPGPGDAGTLRTWPLVEQTLRLLPEPFVRGVTFQNLQSRAAGLTPFFDRLGRGHPTYFLVSLLTKLPLAVLAATGLGLARGRRWPAGSGLLLGLGVLLPLTYMSLFSTLQNGIRNLLPAVVLLCLPAARGGVWLWQQGRGGRRAALALAAWLGGCHVVTWPRYDAAFNLLAGRRPYLIFADANIDWSTAHNCDHDAMRARHPEATLLRREQGPRFGLLLVRGTELAAPDPRDPTRLYHWLRRFRPADRLGDWCVFELDEPAFAAADHADWPRARAELALALLGDRQAARALEVVADSDDPDARTVRLAAKLATDGQRDSTEFCELALALGRDDLVLGNPGATPTQRARAHWQRRQVEAVCDLLEAEAATRPLSPLELNLLAGSWYQRGDLERAFAALDRAAPPPGTPGHEEYQRQRQALQADTQAWQRLLGR
ncbi:MAG: glycosyltransferase family 39 protein [Planctomycetota bacterium]